MPKDLKSLVSECAGRLESDWCSLLGRAVADDDGLDPALRDAIRRSINSATKTYRYVLPTQVVAKIVDPTVDSRCLQAIRGGRGAFDARSLCHAVVVPFDQANDFVLGGSNEPYVNNPLRQPEVSVKYRSKQKDKTGWDDLCVVLQSIESRRNPDFTVRVWRQVLVEIYRRLSEVHVVYPAPQRASLARCEQLITSYLAVQAGGARVQSVAAALFAVIGTRFLLFREVRRGNVNASDTSSGQVADLECVDESGNVLLAVEVKDRDLTVSQLKSKLSGIRAARVREFFFIAQGGIAPEQEIEVTGLIDREFASGQNIYVFDLLGFAGPVLALLGEAGRVRFLQEVGVDLDRSRVGIQHRRAWANLLSQA